MSTFEIPFQSCQKLLHASDKSLGGPHSKSWPRKDLIQNFFHMQYNQPKLLFHPLVPKQVFLWLTYTLTHLHTPTHTHTQKHLAPRSARCETRKSDSLQLCQVKTTKSKWVTFFTVVTKERTWIMSLAAKSWKLGAMFFDGCSTIINRVALFLISPKI